MEKELLSDQRAEAIDSLTKLRKLNLSPKNRKKKITVEAASIFVGGIITFLLAARFDVLERVIQFSDKHEKWEIDEILTTSLFLAVCLTIFSIRRWRDICKTLNELKYLRGILPVCAGCGNVRDSAGNWSEWEKYIHEHTEAVLSHGLCTDCVKKLYGEEYLNE